MCSQVALRSHRNRSGKSEVGQGLEAGRSGSLMAALRERGHVCLPPREAKRTVERTGWRFAIREDWALTLPLALHDHGACGKQNRMKRLLPGGPE